jgi:hypothetical protein
LVRKIKNEFDHLVNPIYDLDEITKNARPEVDAKYRTPESGYWQMDGNELMMMYASTFNSSLRSRLVYERMMAKYDEFFA